LHGQDVFAGNPRAFFQNLPPTILAGGFDTDHAKFVDGVRWVFVGLDIGDHDVGFAVNGRRAGGKRDTGFGEQVGNVIL